MTQGTNNKKVSVSSVISFDLTQLSNELLASDDCSVLHVKWVDRFIQFSTKDYLTEKMKEKALLLGLAGKKLIKTNKQNKNNKNLNNLVSLKQSNVEL